MPRTTLRLVDRQDAADTALTDIVANDNRRTAARWREVIDGVLAARRRLDFDGAEQALRTALTAAENTLREARTVGAQRAARERRANICRALAEARIEWVDLAGADHFFREAIETFPRDFVDERWRYANVAGKALRRVASLLGRVEAANLAVAFFRNALSEAPGRAEAQNQLGRACIAKGELTWSSEAFEEARVAYDLALVAAGDLAAGQAEAFRCRVVINQAVALRLLATIDEGNSGRLRAECDALLRRTIEALSVQSGPMTHVDLPRAWDNLGALLYDEEKFEEAITAFETARDAWRDREERARTLANLGLAYGKASRFDEALGALNEALLEQPVETRPVAWSRSQQYRGQVLHMYAETTHSYAPQKSLDLFQQTIIALIGAREQRRREWAPMLWAETTAYMGQVFHQLERPDFAVSLYLQAIPHVNIKRRRVIAENITQVFLNHDTLMLYCDMAIKNDLLSDITAVLTAHGVSHQDWGDVCTELAARLSGAPPNFSFEAPSAPTLAERAQAPIPYDRPETGLLPPSQTPSSKADESNRIPTSRFGDIPASLKRQRSYRKRNWSDADISNSQLIAEANQLVGAYNYRRGKGEQFSEADIETYRSAKSLLSAAERRRRASKLARAKPG